MHSNLKYPNHKTRPESFLCQYYSLGENKFIVLSLWTPRITEYLFLIYLYEAETLKQVVVKHHVTIKLHPFISTKNLT